MKLLCLLFFTCFLFAQATFAQRDSTRVEISIEPNEARLLVSPMDSLGFAVIDKRQFNSFDPSHSLKIIGYNMDMQQCWKKTIDYNKHLSLRLYEFQEGKLYLIFGSQTKEEVAFYIIDPINGEAQRHGFFYLDNLLIEHFTVAEEKVYVLGTLKQLPVLLEFDLATKKVVPFSMAINARNVKLLGVFSGFSQVSAMVSIVSNRRKQILVKTFDIKTRNKAQFVVGSPKAYDLLNGKLAILNATDKLVVGTYGYRNKSESQGMYVGGYVGEQEVVKKYHKFVDMNNFFNFLSEKEQQQIKEKISKKAEKGKDLKIKYRLLVHQAIVYNNQYVIVGEAYYPTYRKKWDRRSRARGYYDTRLVFDGYKFTHAIVVAIDKRGDLVWNHSFKINDTQTFQLEERVKTLRQQNRLTLIYTIEGNIYQMHIENGKVLEQTKSIALGTMYANDLIRDSDLGQVEYWYDNYFLAWGSQKIKNKQEEHEGSKRSVFYINKLSY